METLTDEEYIVCQMAGAKEYETPNIVTLRAKIMCEISRNEPEHLRNAAAYILHYLNQKGECYGDEERRR